MSSKDEEGREMKAPVIRRKHLDSLPGPPRWSRSALHCGRHSYSKEQMAGAPLPSANGGDRFHQKHLLFAMPLSNTRPHRHHTVTETSHITVKTHMPCGAPEKCANTARARVRHRCPRSHLHSWAPRVLRRKQYCERTEEFQNFF